MREFLINRALDALDTPDSLLSTSVYKAALAKTLNHLRLLMATHLIPLGVYIIAFLRMSR